MPNNSQSSFSFDVFYTRSPGSLIELLSPADLGPKLQKKAEKIALNYAEVLRIIFTYDSTHYSGYRRIQEGFAAACEGLSIEEWSKLSATEKRDLCQEHCSYYTPWNPASRPPPSLVIYIGGHRNTMASSPSIAAELALKSRIGSSPDSDFEPWDRTWDEAMNTAEIPAAWGWHSRDRKVQFRCESMIFISGLYALWPSIWGKELPVEERSIMKEALAAHLKVVFYHEIIHSARSLIYGLNHITPEKCIDRPRHTRSGMGEAGRLGERIAFGTVVNLAFREGKPLIFECEDDAENTPFELHRFVWRSLFDPMGRAEHPVDEPRRNLSSIIPLNERLKSTSNAEVEVQKLPAQHHPFIIPAVPGHKHSTPEDIKAMKESIGFPNLTRCVVSDWRLGIKEKKDTKPIDIQPVEPKPESAGAAII
ncbi:hypothetical protein GYMLUDRAFT_266151 [Collybiopsis luxurians FD-317 M1]|uniref:Uncharacterized protein n=1 Tax=Collybiopsis luxurians FD-317 M1 TaxID=944289 RepID=A0A0D0BM56_9AGAR|nr:hypothetical protein GYMLUDRAFT_266151 [Collybiopsis luxurians FD-317 M1]